MMVRCPGCRGTFVAEDHVWSPRQCPDCSRQFYPTGSEMRCPTCEDKWADYRAQGGVDPWLEVNTKPCDECKNGTVHPKLSDYVRAHGTDRIRREAAERGEGGS